MGLLFHDYEFKTSKYLIQWESIVNNPFEHMELYHRKEFNMQQLLSHFRQVFKIAPITLKNCSDEKYATYKLFAMYLLTKYSHEEFEFIATEFNVSLEVVQQIAANKEYQRKFDEETRLFFKHFEAGFISSRKERLAWLESAGV